MSSYLKLVGAALLLASAKAYAGPAEDAFTQEVLDCAAYYQISAEAIKAMDAPQMQTVAERLAQSAVAAIELAKQYQTVNQVEQQLAKIREAQIQSMAGSASLANLMAKYKDECKQLLAEPQKRLDYWFMATM
jgi:hypothetical protein